MRRFVILVICCAALWSTIARANAATELQTFGFDGYDRTYRVYRPAGLSWSSPVPLVVVLHGGFGSSFQAESAYHWDGVADEHGFVVLYADGYQRSWNAGGCCGPAVRDGMEDVAFLTNLIEHLYTAQRIDRERVYVTGISNGAMMAYRFACESRLPIAAIGPVSGSLEVPCTDAQRTSVLHIHGLDDHNVPFAGGMPSEGLERSQRRPVPEGIAQWRKIDGCGSASVKKDGPVTTESTNCEREREVTLITVAGAGHQWPGSEPAPGPVASMLHLDPPSQALDATSVLWAFFATHHA